MPKPGPRPYECVRKAWHSDRHQPIRGSLIQEIFRIVNEVHGSATKKNKEWQEKLPIVVFRAEEIMYSKANSEAEYMDLETLWDRLNDSIDTILRRDDNTESGPSDLLQPCIEAALHLGCSPKRSSRSQRNSSPRYYLSRVTPESNSVVTTGNSHDRNRVNPFPNSQFFSKDDKFVSATLKSSNPCVPESNKRLHFSTLKFPPSVSIQTFPMKNAGASPTSCSMYPLYHGCQFEPSGPKLGTTRSDATQLVVENKTISLRNPDQSCNVKASSETSRTDNEDASENQTVIGCDLSLRLGSFVVPCTRVDNTSREDDDKAGDICKLNDLSPQFNRGLSFFFKENADKNQFESSSMSSNGQNLNVKSVLAKRKLGEDQQIYSPVKLPFNKFRS